MVQSVCWNSPPNRTWQLIKIQESDEQDEKTSLHCRNDRNIGFKASYQYGRYDFLLDLTTCCSWCACATKIITCHRRQTRGLTCGEPQDCCEGKSLILLLDPEGQHLEEVVQSLARRNFFQGFRIFSDAILLVQFVVYPWNPFKLCLSEFLVMGPGMGIGWKTVFPGWPLTLVSFDLLLPAKKGQGAEYTSQLNVHKIILQL